MKVKELLEELKNVNPELELIVAIDVGCCGDEEYLVIDDVDGRKIYLNNHLPGFRSCRQYADTRNRHEEYWNKWKFMRNKILKFIRKKDSEATILSEFPVLHRGWELDYTGYLVKHKNKTKIVMTNHGNPYFSDEHELSELLKIYNDAVLKTEETLEKLYQKDKHEL